MNYSNTSNSNSLKNIANSNKKNKNFWTYLILIIWILFVVGALTKTFIFQQVNVVGASMEPNYFTNENLLINQIDTSVVRGQVVAVFEDPTVIKDKTYTGRFVNKYTSIFFLKRVIGLPGESIEMIGGDVIIYNTENPSGAVLKEDYVDPNYKAILKANNFYFKKTLVSQNHYFLLGDHRNNSKDSRNLGAFPDYAILGKEVVKYWPLGKLRYFSLPNYTFLSIDADVQRSLDIQKTSVLYERR